VPPRGGQDRPASGRRLGTTGISRSARPRWKWFDPRLANSSRGSVWLTCPCYTLAATAVPALAPALAATATAVLAKLGVTDSSTLATAIRTLRVLVMAAASGPDLAPAAESLAPEVRRSQSTTLVLHRTRRPDRRLPRAVGANLFHSLDRALSTWTGLPVTVSVITEAGAPVDRIGAFRRRPRAY